MLDITKLLTDEFVDRLAEGYQSAFGAYNAPAEYEKLITENAREVLSIIASSNTLYHNVEHTIQVTLVGQALLLGKLKVDEQVSPKIWLNCIMSLLCHDIGYVPGILISDASGTIGENASGALLMPVHIDRGKRYAKEAFSGLPGMDVDFIQDCIERTRFPIPAGESYQMTDDFPGLIRGADLVGQLSDPRYFNKLPAVFFEFEESGYNEVTGYKQPADLLRNYMSFYEGSVEPYVQATLDFLSMTSIGQSILRGYEANKTFARENTHRF